MPALWGRQLTDAYRSIEVSLSKVYQAICILYLMLAVYEATSAKCSDFTSKH
jgi:hypothetical protein